MRIVDNPGDTPVYALVALLSYSSGSGESPWLYEGWDAASGDGFPLRPIGATFHEAVVVLLLGLADLLFLPSKKAQPLVGVARKTWDAKQRRLAAEALAGIEQLIEASRDVDAARGPPTGLFCLTGGGRRRGEDPHSRPARGPVASRGPASLRPSSG